ncbi:MAG: hypothetical protein U0V64_14135 [Cyclobacteriaceae bacterium]
MKLSNLCMVLSLSAAVLACAGKEGKEEGAAADSLAVDASDYIDVTGDFDGDGKTEQVFVKAMNDGTMNPDEPMSYMIGFSDPKFSSLEITPMVPDGYMVLSEGNLDGAPGDELSVSTCDVNRAAAMTLYKWTGSQWLAIAEDLAIVCQFPEGTDPFSAIVDTDSGVYATEYEVISYDSVTFRSHPMDVATTAGDFDGDGNQEAVLVTTVSDPTVDESATASVYRIHWLDSRFPEMKYADAQPFLCTAVNEGDLDGVAGDELTIARQVQNNQMLLEVFSFVKGKWLLRASETSNQASITAEDAIYKDSEGVFVRHQELGEEKITTTKVAFKK